MHSNDTLLLASSGYPACKLFGMAYVFGGADTTLAQCHICNNSLAPLWAKLVSMVAIRHRASNLGGNYLHSAA